MKVIKNEEIAPRVFLLTICNERIASLANPGQFVNIRVSDSYFPLLRRPLSVHSVEGDTFKVLYKVVGEGTKILSTYRPGDKLDIIGPLGTQFTYAGYKNILVIAGGMGVAPLYFLVERMQNDMRDTQNLAKNITILIGAKTSTEVICEQDFAKLGKEVRPRVMVTTEDGSYGTQGIVTDLLKKESFSPEIIFACGPLGMLKAVKSYAIRYDIPCQLALEQHMACGVGVCLGCAIPGKHGYKYVCKDGPVFWADEIEI